MMMTTATRINCDWLEGLEEEAEQEIDNALAIASGGVYFHVHTEARSKQDNGCA